MDFTTLIIDTFNMSSSDPFLQQMLMQLICRCYSANSELTRNLDRMVLLFDAKDVHLYQWTCQQIEKFIETSEKSSMWFSKIKSFINEERKVEANQLKASGDLFELKSILSNLKKVIQYDGVFENIDDDELAFRHKEGERVVNPYVQDLYRNLKLYDYLINFLFQSKDLLLKIRTMNANNLNADQKKTVEIVRKVFKSIFKLLEVMAKDNLSTQELFWKYKEEFIFEELDNTPQEGELSLVLAIIDSNDTSRSNYSKWTLSQTKYTFAR